MLSLITWYVVCLVDHLAHLDMVHMHSSVTRSREGQFCQLLSTLLSSMLSTATCAVQWAADFHMSDWLNVLPLAYHHSDLSAQEFRDAHCLCYHHPLSLTLAFVMVVEEILVWLMLWIVIRVLWSLSATMKFEMLWVTRLLWDCLQIYS